MAQIGNLATGVQFRESGLRNRWAVHAVAEPPQRNDPVVAAAAASGMSELAAVVEKARAPEKEVEAVAYEKMAEELQNASPLEIMDRALAEFGNDIAIAFR